MRTYLDHNATSPLKPAARHAMAAALDRPGNPSSIHAEGRKARALIDTAREWIARSLGVLPAMVVFTSGGTEANNLAIHGVPVERLAVSAVEHPSVIEAAKARGLPVEIIPVDASGLVKLDELRAILKRSPLPTLISVMLVNNETGVVQPVRADCGDRPQRQCSRAHRCRSGVRQDACEFWLARLRPNDHICP